MSKKSSPRGKRITLACLAVIYSIIAGITVREVIADSPGYLSKITGMATNDAIIGASKLGMGVSDMLADVHADQKIREKAAPSGMIVASSAVSQVTEVPRGIRRKGDASSFVAGKSKVIGKASHSAFISASKVEIYGE